jgi:hypothetical protein
VLAALAEGINQSPYNVVPVLGSGDDRIQNRCGIGRSAAIKEDVRRSNGEVCSNGKNLSPDLSHDLAGDPSSLRDALLHVLKARQKDAVTHIAEQFLGVENFEIGIR